MSRDAQILADAVREVGKGLLLVVTGAGVSVASGIPTFRGEDPHAVWKRDVTELGTYRYFRQDPVGSWTWYLRRFDKVLGARPNAAHRAITDLERWQTQQGGDFLLVTQNIDTLHEDAGSERMIKVHGTANRVRCARTGCRYGAPSGSLLRTEIAMEAFQDEPSLDTLPRCPACGDFLRQHVLWFDEVYTSHEDYRFESVQAALERMALVVFVGTSFSVGITEMALQAGVLWRIPMISIDPTAAFQLPSLTLLEARAEEVLPTAYRLLRAT